MKSFDEVTKALSICGRRPDCKGCPYENVSYPTEIGNTCKDIMHYDALYYMQNRCEIFDIFENLPLTWDEFQLMEGKPVWIEGPFITEGPHWIIVGPSHLYDGKIVGYGKTWQAYRRERK